MIKIARFYLRLASVYYIVLGVLYLFSIIIIFVKGFPLLPGLILFFLVSFGITVGSLPQFLFGASGGPLVTSLFIATLVFGILAFLSLNRPPSKTIRMFWYFLTVLIAVIAITNFFTIPLTLPEYIASTRTDTQLKDIDIAKVIRIFVSFQFVHPLLVFFAVLFAFRQRSEAGRSGVIPPIMNGEDSSTISH